MNYPYKCEFEFDYVAPLNVKGNLLTAFTTALPAYVQTLSIWQQGKGYFTKRQGYNSYMFIYVVSGSCLMRHLEEEVILTSHQLFLVDCRLPHFYKTYGDEPLHYLLLHFNGSVCSSFFDLISKGAFTEIFDDSLGYIENCFASLNDYMCARSDYNDILSMNTIIEMLTYMLKKSKKNSAAKEHLVSNCVNIVIDYINKNYSQAITLEQLSIIAHFSQNQLIRLFKNATGITPYDYLINVRINNAKHLLISTGISVEEISFYVGFNDSSNFITHFKNITGISPAKYRKNPYSILEV